MLNGIPYKESSKRLSELLLRSSDPTSSPVVGDKAREAVAALRGYAYQLYASALAWLDLPPGHSLYLEVAEDFAVAAGGSLAAVQVKDIHSTVSLASKQARDAISGFVRLVRDNPASAVRLTLLTTSTITTERRQEHRTGKVPGIERWRAAAEGGNIADLRKALLRLDLHPDAHAFIRERDDERLRRELLLRIEWRCGQGDIAEIAARFEERVGQFCFEEFGLPLAESPPHAALLLVEILEVCSQAGTRIRSPERLRAILSSSTRVSTPRREYDALISVLAGSFGGPAMQVGFAGGWEAEDKVPLPAGLVPRAELVGKLRSALRDNSMALLHGGSGMGKTSLARLAVRTAGGPWNLLDLRNRTSEEASEQLSRYARRPRDSAVGLIADDIPDVHLMGGSSGLGRAIRAVVERGESLVLTSYRRPTGGGRRELGLVDTSVLEVPVLTTAEVSAIVVEAGGDEGWAGAVWLASRGGHPQLTRALAFGLKERGWPIDERDGLLTRGAPEIAEELEATRLRLMSAVPDEPGRTLLHRLGLISGRFPRKVAIALDGVQPETPLPGERFDALVGPWIDSVGTDRYRVSPLVVGSGDDVLPPGQVTDAHRAIAEALVTPSGIHPDQIDNILLHGRAGGARRALAVVARLIITSKRDMLARMVPLAPQFRAADTSQPLFQAEPKLGLLLRLAQASLAAARGFDIYAIRASRALMREVKAFEGPGKNAFELTAVNRLLFERGFSASVPEWLDFLADHLEGANRSIEQSPGTPLDHRPLGPVLLAFNLSTLGSVAQLADAFGRLAALGSRRAVLMGPMDGILSPSVVVLSPWLKERGRGSADAGRAVEEYTRLADLTKAWGQPDWTVALLVAAAEVRYQDLRDAAAALTVLDGAEAALGSDPWFTRTRQKVLWGERRDVDVLTLIPTLKAAFVHKPIELIGLLREGAISASRLGRHALAADWLGSADAASANVSLVSHRAVGIGLAADAATELWRSGDRLGSLRKLSDVMGRLNALDPDTDLQAGYVHRVVRHALLWFADAAGMHAIRVGRDAPALPPGVCSNPDPPADILELPVVLIDIGHYWLAQIACAAGFPDGVAEPHGRLSGKPVVVMEVAFRKDRLDRAILDGNLTAFLQALPPALDALMAMPGIREAGAAPTPDEWERGDIPRHDPADPGVVPFIKDAILSIRLASRTASRPDADAGLREALPDIRVPLAAVHMERMFPEAGVAGSRSAEQCINLVGMIDLGPDDLLECCFRVAARLEKSEFKRLLTPPFVRWAKREWLRIAEERRFSLRAPSVTAPDISLAARRSGEDLSDLARLLDAAVPGTPAAVPEAMRRWARERARPSGTVAPSSNREPPGTP